MGYTTDFEGRIEVTPVLTAEEIAYINKFSESRRMNRTKGPYFVDGTDTFGQGKDSDIIDYNTPPDGQPGLWCNWVATEDGSAIEWNGGEKFYHPAEWMEYLINHFLGNSPIAHVRLPFLTGHSLNGRILAQGEDINDRWELIVVNNKVAVKQLA